MLKSFEKQTNFREKGLSICKCNSFRHQTFDSILLYFSSVFILCYSHSVQSSTYQRTIKMMEFTGEFLAVVFLTARPSSCDCWCDFLHAKRISQLFGESRGYPLGIQTFPLQGKLTG